jgi:hypothetical protein
MAGIITANETGTTKAPVAEGCASRSEAPQLRMEQEPERGQHIPDIPPGQHSMPVPDAAITTGAWNAMSRERSDRTARAFSTRDQA